MLPVWTEPSKHKHESKAELIDAQQKQSLWTLKAGSYLSEYAGTVHCMHACSYCVSIFRCPKLHSECTSLPM